MITTSANIAHIKSNLFTTLTKVHIKNKWVTTLTSIATAPQNRSTVVCL